MGIETRYLGATNFRGARVVASTGEPGERVVVNWDFALDSEPNYRRAAVALVEKLGWSAESTVGEGLYVGGRFVFPVVNKKA